MNISSDTDTLEETSDSEFVEPASSHDIAEGGVIGAVGGAIIGMLAGGPIGAVVGAVIGGGASAVAVDLVDYHDRDSESMDVRPEARESIPFSSVTGTDQEQEYATASQPMERTYISEPVPDLTVIVAGGLREVIRLRAYELYEERGHQDGFADRDWYDAEREVKITRTPSESGTLPAIVEEIDGYVK